MIVIKSDHAKPNCSETHHTKYRISEFFKPRQCSKHYNEYPYTEKPVPQKPVTPTNRRALIVVSGRITGFYCKGVGSLISITLI